MTLNLNRKDSWSVLEVVDEQRSTELHRMAQSERREIRLAAAKNTHCEEDTLHYLRYDDDPDVRRACAQHWLCLPETVGFLMSDGDASVREAAWSVWDQRLRLCSEGSRGLKGARAAEVRRLLASAVRDSAKIRAIVEGCRS